VKIYANETKELPRTMKAMILDEFGPTSEFRWDEWPMPEPELGEIRIRIEAVAINPVDWKMRRGLLKVPLPVVLGRDVCGVVDAVGDGVSEFKPGDKVVGALIGPRSNGAYAQFVTTPAAFVGRQPEGLSRTEAATLGVAGLTAHRAVMGAATIRPGDTVLVAGGSGGVGSFAMPLLRLQGAGAIIATAGSDASEQFLIETLGVDRKHVVRYLERSVEDLVAEIRDLTNGRGVAAAFDFAGGDMKEVCFRSIGFDGQIVSVVEEGPDFELDIWGVGGPMFDKSASYHLVSLSARSRNGAPQDWAIYRQWINDWLSLVSSGKISIAPVTTLGALTEEKLLVAHSRLESHLVQGKLALTVEH
jgi:NADPH2:quinone reductase